MKQNNLWIAALALGITLSAHGQQSGGGISPTMLQQIKQSYQGTPTDKAIRNAITNNDINKLAVNGESKNNLDTYFSNKVESKGISNQRSSGRCWLFTGLNVFRAQAIHKYDMVNSNSPRIILSSGINWRKRTFSYRASSILV